MTPMTEYPQNQDRKGFFDKKQIPTLKGKRVYCVGIKGTGMAAMAELLLARGSRVSGSDVKEVFYTDAVLKDLGISFYEGFREENLDPRSDLIVHSAAYDRHRHPELKRAVNLGIPVMEYSEALGYLSSLSNSVAVSGVHGKTTTTAMAATILKGLSFPAQVLVGSAVHSLGGRSTYNGGEQFFIAETCEYRRHFLSFHPQRLIITSVEPDHLDYYKDFEDIKNAFIQFGGLLPEDGGLIYCNDDEGTRAVVESIVKRNPSLREVPYGFSAAGDYRIIDAVKEEGKSRFCLAGGWGPYEITIPGEHSLLNASAAIALVRDLMKEQEFSLSPPERERRIREALSSFKGSKRRSEVLGEAGGVLFMDDYGHHPTAIRKTLAGIRDFYPQRRIIVDFMSHTYSRTRALLMDFAAAFDLADQVVLHKIYSSARESDKGEGLDEEFFHLLKEKHPNHGVHYFPEIMDAREFVQELLVPGDLFLTLGAGNNWILGDELFKIFSKEKEST